MPNSRTILVFKHMPSQNPGIFRKFASERDIQFHEIDLHAGDPIPDIDLFDGLWVMGGSMNVWEEDEFPWLIEEKKNIRQAVENEMPFLGICFGHQLLAEAFGGKVEKASHFEIGSYSIEPTDAGLTHPFMKDLCREIKWANVHLAEVVKTPSDAIILAKSKTCENHAMAIGDNAFSVQFHPEVCNTTLSHWLEIPGITPMLKNLLGEQGFDNFKYDIEKNRLSTNLGAKKLFENWLTLVFS